VNIAGVLSGTSLDGIDVALCEITARGEGARVRCERFATVPFDDRLRGRILAAYPPAPVGALEVAALHAAIGDAFGAAVRQVAGEARLDAIGSHGITLAHDDAARVTLQIGDPFRIRERAGVTVVSDFRSADTAAGGTGAPLVPFVDALLFGEGPPCVALNLGGIANITVLPDGIAFDTGPANLPIDTYVAARSGGTLRFDRDGALAAAGRPASDLLDRLLDDPYFRRVPPKSTGREQYGMPFVARHREALDALPFEDAVATLAELCARSVADAIRRSSPSCARLIVSGGGARNPAIVAALRRLLPNVRVLVSDELGVDADAKEAIAFAVLALWTLRGRAANLPAVTGARGPRVLGSIAPHGLEALLERVRAEEKSEA
jgi:anhydro-N-acetylmuramic acid kinase